MTGTVTAGTKSGTEPQLHCAINNRFSGQRLINKNNTIRTQ